MRGFLDELNQAFLTLELGLTPLDFQIDTGFNGTLIVGEELFDPACGTPTGTMKAELADEHIATYDTYDVVLPWFDEDVQIQILIGPGKLCLLGTDLLHPHRLEIDYGQQIVRLVQKPDW